MVDTTQPPITDDNVAYLVYIPAGVFFFICPVLVALRLLARLRRGGGLGADDWAAVLALCFTLLTSGFLVAACQHGMGRHIKLLTPDEKLQTFQYFFTSQVTYKMAISLSKVCILLLYLRIFESIRWFKISCWVMLGAVSSYCVASVTASIFQCNPVRKAIDKTIPGTCINMTQFWYANAGFSISTDIIILLLPMPLVYKLKITGQQKLALVAVFMIGIFVVITSCLRITTLNILATTPDTTYDIANVMWTIIEPNMAVVCACLPILRPFIVKLIPSLRSKATKIRYVTSPYGPASGQGSSSRSHNRNNWLEIDNLESSDIHTAVVERSLSASGSEVNILESGEQGPGCVNGETGIKKTVQYSIKYSKP